MSKVFSNLINKVGVFFMFLILALSFSMFNPTLSYSKTTGWLYGDALVIGNPDSPVYKISTAGVLSGSGVASQTTVDASYKSVTATYGITGATGSFSGTFNASGNSTFGAAGYKSTNTASTGAWAFPATVDITGALTAPTINTGQGAAEVYLQNQNLRTTDSVTFLNATATYGIVAASGTFTGSTVSVSSSATSGLSMCLAGAFESLPTTGYGEGCFAYQNSDNTLYVSTEAVSVSGSWKAVW